MTVNTQELRELVEKAIQRAYYLGQEYCRLADSESWSNNRRSFDIQDKFDALRSETVSVAGAEVAALLDEIDALRAALHTLICEVVGLAEESEGVYGLHLNGDPSPWEELLPGGRFERLTSLHDAEALIAPPQGETA